jgi:iron complex outermembrane receptor protein
MHGIRKAAVVLAAAAVFTGSSIAALAQDAADEAVLEEITVTARKVTERLLDAPLSITAYTSEAIDEKGLKTLEDVARSTPGMQYSLQGGQIPGRYNSAIRFRGMNVNSASPSLQLAALFVDGIFSLGGTQSIPYDDLERIEVVRGPQSATYGRSTFAGAVNYITRTPSLTDYSGQVSLSSATYSDNTVSASFEGPIIEDKLSFRIGGRYYSRGGVDKASDGGELGEESSRSFQGTLYFKPVEALSIKLRGFYGKDDDGPALGGLVQGIRNNTCAGVTIRTQDPLVPVAQPMNYVCGAVPEQGQAISATGGFNIIDTPTSLRTAQAAAIGLPNYLIDNLVRRALPAAVSSAPPVDSIGLLRNVARYSVQADYDFANGYTLAFQAGKNRLRSNWIRPFGLTPLGLWWSRDPQDSEDKSYELRLTSPQENRFTWMLGVNKYDQDFISSGSGGDAVNLCWPVPGRPLRAAGAPCVVGDVTGQLFPNTLAQDSDHVETFGVFAAASVKFNDQWTLSLEGRYQKDESTSGVLTAAPVTVEESGFLPRAIVRWQPNNNTNLYASFSKGVLPPQVNTQLAIATARELAQYQAAQPGVPTVIPGDALDMYEIGWKQRFWENRAEINLSVYSGKWTDQKGRSVAAIREDCGSPSHGFGTAASRSGCLLPGEAPSAATGQLAAPGQPATNFDGTPFLNFRNFNVPGNSTLEGVEFAGTVAVTDRFQVGATFTLAKTEYEFFVFNFLSAISQFTQMKGNQNARFPETSGSLNASYQAPFKGDWQWFMNGDLGYVGKTYTDESNLAYCKGYTTANIRGGFEKENLRIEGFVLNATDEDAWAACSRWSDFDTVPTIGTAFQGVAVSKQIPRQVGLRATIKF